MRLRFHPNKKKIFWRFFIPYVAFLVITIFVGSITYNQTFKMVKETVIENNMSSLRQSKQLLDTRLMEIENIVIQLSLDNRVRSFYSVSKPLLNTDYYKMRQLMVNMPSYQLTNRFILDTIIYFKNSDVFVSSLSASSRAELFYNKHIKYNGMNFDNWRTKILSKFQNKTFWPAENVIVNDHQCSAITFIQSMPVESYKNNAVIIVLIDEQELHKAMPALSANVDWYYIEDREGNIITYSQPGGKKIQHIKLENNKSEGIIDRTISGEKMTLIYTKSSYNGWTYVAAFPTSVFMSKVNYFRNIYLNTAFIIIILGALIFFYLAYENIIPIREIIKGVNLKLGYDDGQVQNEYDYLKHTMEKLIYNNEQLKTDMKAKTALLKTVFFERLFRNGFNTIQELETTLAHVGLDIKGLGFVVIILKISGYNEEISEDILKELEMTRLIVNSTLEQTLGKHAFLHDIDNDKISVLLVLDSTDEKECVHYIGNITQIIIEQLNGCLNNRIIFGIGDMYENLIDMSMSFEEAGKALNYKAMQNDTEIIWYKQLPKHTLQYYYPLDIQIRLMNLVKTGDINDIEPIIKTLYLKNFAHNLLPPDKATQLIYEMRGTILRLKEQLFFADNEASQEIENNLNQMTIYKPAEVLNRSLREIYKYMCKKVNEQKKSYRIILTEKIIGYIHSEYYKEGFALHTVAKRFNLSEKYCSEFFKEMTGQNFSTYLEKIRIEHSIELLCKGNKPVKEIAEESGYSNVNTFYKAFKRVYGESPSDYRNRIVVGN